MNTYDPFAVFRSMWESIGFTVPPMMTAPTNLDELQNRLKELKSVEGWLRMNLNVLQMTIQTMEMQHATLSALQSAMSASPMDKQDEAPSAEPAKASEKTQTPEENPFAKFFSNPATNPALWAWVNPDMTVPTNVADSFKDTSTSAPSAKTENHTHSKKPVKAKKTATTKDGISSSPRTRTHKPRN